MGIKIDGFVCDNCRTFRKHVGVSSSDPDDLFEIVSEIKQTISFKKIVGWKYYNVLPSISGKETWLRWSSDSTCYCPSCDRVVKIKKILLKLKNNE